MFKFVLMTGVFLGSLAGMSGAVQAFDSGAKPFHPAQVSSEKGKAEQSLGSAMAMAKVYRVREAVLVYFPADKMYYLGEILAVHSGRGTYQVRIYLNGRNLGDYEVGADRLKPR